MLAEILEKRCGSGTLTDVFPGIGAERLDLVQTKAI